MPPDSEDSQKEPTEALPHYIVEAHGPAPEEPGRRDWKMMLIVGGGFLVLTVITAIAMSDRPRTDPERITAVTMPMLASGVCMLFGLWKLARLKDRTPKEEQALGFLSVFLLAPLHFNLFFIPFLVMLAIKRDTSNADVSGKFAAGAGWGCLTIFVILLLLAGLGLGVII